MANSLVVVKTMYDIKNLEVSVLTCIVIYTGTTESQIMSSLEDSISQDSVKLLLLLVHIFGKPLTPHNVVRFSNL